ncbi:MAG TPA: U32 family peptidase [Candidatus Thermoplasmatota archaeon]|jgi:putative protease|nr:U32 family peptidase [Candidatus Thermoplasmatota archaeon]
MARKVELLAPAGNFEALQAAVENGADAVYLGGKGFHARDRAVNFGDEELAKALDYAHEKGASVYLTVNTLLTNAEFQDLGPYLAGAREMGIDAFIVQDLGVMQFARTHFPDVPIHMSTQASIHNARSVELLEKWGVERIILPRELELPEIKAMAARTKVPLEVFVHGAQCYSYSGQCLASSLIGGRSGNRGKCASTCRWPYELLKSEGAVATGAENKPGSMDDWTWTKMETPEGVYLESSRDMCTIEALPQIIDAGVVSLKIEGRMRRPEYVAIVTNIYRRGLERLAKGNFYVTAEEQHMLMQAFNREFAPGYFLGNQGNAFVSAVRPDNRGIWVGEVVRANRDRMEVKLRAPLRVGDGVEVWGQSGDFGERVQQMWAEGQAIREARAGDVVQLPKRGGFAAPGDRMYKSSDAQVLAWAQRTFHGESRRLPVSVRATLRDGQLALAVRDDEGRVGEATAEAVPATGHAFTPELLKGQLKQLASARVKPRAFEVDVRGRWWVPRDHLERAWAQAGTALAEARASQRHRAPAPLAKAFGEFLSLPARQGRARPELAVACPNLPSVRAALAGGADAIYYAPLDYGGDHSEWSLPKLREAIQLCDAAGKPFWLHAPYITRDADLAYMEELAPALEEAGVRRVIAGNLGVLALAKERGWQVRADYYLNAYNGYTVRVLQGLGVESVALSPELNLAQMAELAPTAPLPLEAIIHGQLHLMISEHCIIGAVEGCYTQGKHVPCRRAQYALRDEKGYVFPLVTDGKCRMHMMNSREVAMLDRLQDLMAAQLDIFRIHAVGLNPANLQEVVRAHVDALDAFAAGAYDAKAAGERLQAARTLKLTTGHFFRGAL